MNFPTTLGERWPFFRSQLMGREECPEAAGK